jgi:predicted molibdopterin-dependent oxidoreductase YjgC
MLMFGMAGPAVAEDNGAQRPSAREQLQHIHTPQSIDQELARRAKVRALVTDRVQGKEPCMPMNSVESPVNRLTSSHTDSVTHMPAYKEASVRLKVLPEVGESPLRRINHRFGHPTPQNGVEVERKWKRPDLSHAG